MTSAVDMLPPWLVERVTVPCGVVGVSPRGGGGGSHPAGGGCEPCSCQREHRGAAVARRTRNRRPSRGRSCGRTGWTNQSLHVGSSFLRAEFRSCCAVVGWFRCCRSGRCAGYSNRPGTDGFVQ